ncbi:MAG: hypothetical protein QOD99_1486 [Chthoniobacter sp.]|jgi:hypothetical protein|nr:hypothetical protein [Chthoniobacter sp.]
MFKPRTLFFATLLLAAAPALLAEDTVELHPQWLVGKRYFMTTRMDQEMTFGIGDKTMNQHVNNTNEMIMTVTQHEDGKSKRVSLLYGRMQMEMEMNGQKSGFDSDKPDAAGDAQGMGKIMGALVKKEVRIVLNEKNVVTEVENAADLLKDMPPGPMDGAMKKMLSNETFTQMMNQSMLKSVPPGPVKPGDQWPVSVDLDLPQLGKISVNGTYTFKGMVDHDGVRCAEIANDAQLAMDLSGLGSGAAPDAAKAIQSLGMKLDNGTLTGTTWFDPALGMARDAALDQTLTMSMKNPTDPGKTIEIPMKQKITLKLTKVEDVK